MVENCKDCDEREMFYQSFEEDKPYITLQHNENGIIRKFLSDTEPHLLKWHSDESDRVVKPLYDSDWKFQFDNELPITLTTKCFLHIEKGRIHRLIKGTKDLVIHISEL